MSHFPDAKTKVSQDLQAPDMAGALDLSPSNKLADVMDPDKVMFAFSPASQALAVEPPSKITARNQRESPLLRLPGELRNKIYAHAQQIRYVVVINEQHHMQARPPFELADIMSSEICRRVGVNKSSRGAMDKYVTLKYAVPKYVTPVDTMFSLHLVCRQITAEIDRVGEYRHTIFGFPSKDIAASCASWLSDAQKFAIREIACRLFCNHQPEGVNLESALPSLKRIYFRKWPTLGRDDRQTFSDTMKRQFRSEAAAYENGLEVVGTDPLDYTEDSDDARLKVHI